MVERKIHSDLLNNVLWYKDAVIYQAHVKSFFDLNNDGVGDFPGFIKKLDYIVDLGVNAIWLLPFYPSPMRDDGYDIAEYCNVHPAYGSMNDVRRFIAEAHNRDLRVITELVINHTSDQHAWFQKSRRSKRNSKARNFYVWSDTNQKYEGTRIIFPDVENSNWTWDPIANQYFWHRFFSHQPDLNFDNPNVLKKIIKIMRFWFDIGVDGLRLDAIPYLVEREGSSNENLPETHEIIKKIRAELDTNYPDRLLLAEANLWPEDIQQYFGQGDECHMAFHFPLMPRMYMAIAQEDRFPIIDILRQMPDIPPNCQWAIFLRNHDELTLEMVTEQERDYLWNHYAADRRARINLGIRRRLAPLVDKDRRRIELLNSLLLSMPGTPVLYYGDEIGMGDNISLGDRHGVRTPMQWSDDRNGGFSRTDSSNLITPVITDPLYGFQVVNVESQARDIHSLLNWTRRIVAIRQQHKAFGRGSLKLLTSSNRRILSYLREYIHSDGNHEIILCIANVCRSAQAVQLDLSAYAGKIPIELIGGSSFPPIGKLDYQLILPPYGFYWFLLGDETHLPGWYVEPLEPMPELETIIIKSSLLELMESDSVRSHIESESLPGYLSKCPWFTFSETFPSEAILQYAIPFGKPADSFVFTEVSVNRNGVEERYFLPLGVIADHLAGTSSRQLALVRVRHKQHVGLLTDAFTLPEFSRKVINHLQKQATLSFDRGELHFIAHSNLVGIDSLLDDNIDLADSLSVNGSVIIGEKLRLKSLRKIISGIHPEVEVSRYLNDLNFPNIAPLLGEVKRVDEQGKSCTLMILQGFVSNQGDAWQWTQNALRRGLRDQLSAGSSFMDMQYSAATDLENFAKIVGDRLGLMHLLLSRPDNNLRFGAVESTSSDLLRWTQDVRSRIEQAVEILRNQENPDNNWIVNNTEKIYDLIECLAENSLGGMRIRIHGNMHLAQILVVAGDAYFVNFEDGFYQYPINGATLFQSPLKDVADMICSFNDAAAMVIRNAESTDLIFDQAEVNQLVTSYINKAIHIFSDAYFLSASELSQGWQKRDSEKSALTLFCIDNRARGIIKTQYHPELMEIHIQSLKSFFN